MLSRRRVPIQAYLAALFALVTLAIGLSTAGLFYGRMKTASLNSSELAFKQISTSIAQTFTQIRSEIGYEMALATASPLATSTTFAARLRAKDVLRGVLDANPYVVAAYVGYPNGDFLLLRRVQSVDDVPASIHARAVYVVRGIERTQHGMHGRFWFYDGNLKLIAERDEPRFKFDPRTRPWYAATVGHEYVAPPYVFYSTHHVGLTFAQRAPVGSVFGADVDVASISDKLAALLPTKSAIAAVLTPDGTIMASSNRAQLENLIRDRPRPASIDDLRSEPLSAAFAAARSKPTFETQGSFRDAHGSTWLYAVTPGKDTEGRFSHNALPSGARDLPRGLLILAAPEDELIADALRVRADASIVCVALILAVIPLTFWLSRFVSRPLGGLRTDALALRNLDFSERPPRDSFIAEIGEFSDTFGAMRTHIRDYNLAATRFVPRQFLDQLGRNDINGLQLGDHAEGTMAILFSDIRSFTTLSGAMTPEQTFKFVNSYLTRIGPIIREYHGFIDKYIGDAIMALFPQSAAQALNAAIAMQKRVVIYNEERSRAGYPPVKIGIGVHTGDLMLGTIGETERFETTVISDAVNIASRLESLTKTFGVLILASGAVMSEVDSVNIHARRLGDVQVKGATHPVTIYDVFEADPPDLFEHKMETRDAFDLGRVAYKHGDFTEAYRYFREVARNKQDHAAAYYRDRSAIMASAVRSLEWDGVEHMESK